MIDLESSYAHCRGVARSQARNFYYSFVLLPRAERDAMCAIYAFMRRSDDIADDPSVGLAARRATLGHWRDDLLSALDGLDTNHSLFPAFLDTVRRYGIPHEYFLHLIDGMQADLQGHPHRKFEDLYRYCYQAASVVGMTTVHVLGCATADSLPLAEKCGVAFQLTNILRDVAEDTRLGRVYFPDDELTRFSLQRSELVEGAVPASDPRFQALMQFQWNRADEYYRESLPLLEMAPSSTRPALWTMVAIYRGTLLEIRRSGYDVLERRIGLSMRQKSIVVARAMWARFTGRSLPCLE